MELFKSPIQAITEKNSIKFTELFWTKYTELWGFFMKIPYFVLKSSVNFIEVCSVIACIRDSWIVPENVSNNFFSVVTVWEIFKE